MTTRPVIGVTAGRGQGIDRYEDAVRYVGAEPRRMDQQGDHVDQVAAIILSGGPDVDPQRYGQSVTAEIEKRTNLNIDRERDDFEWQTLQRAIARGLPVLAICRGLQVVNVYFGGSLHLDLGSAGFHQIDHQPGGDRAAIAHSVNVIGGRLRSVAADGALEVNSIHHQGVSRLGDGLVATAISDDGLVEGLETPDASIVAVQWHPESLVRSHAVARRLFEDLLDRSSAAGLPVLAT